MRTAYPDASISHTAPNDCKQACRLSWLSGFSAPKRAVAPAATKYDYDLLIIGCGVGGHGAALHAVEKGMKVGVVEGHDIGGTCVNRGCVPSKALLAASGRVREMRNEMHLKSMGIQVRSDLLQTNVSTFEAPCVRAQSHWVP